MDRSILRLLTDYKWTVIGFLTLFIFSLLLATLGFWITIVIVILSVLGGMFGYLRDANGSFREIFKNLKE